ncbi:tRNA lysidine(34) synthetase TilS [Bifidobacterium sp. UTBIF-78]|uniref:tRNA lysidine(34) synthetase TilS n=1 Tax=Bifidobacterium sp. UTBIF-78 TaxID=1465263 RepID=UPI00112E727E|nr:tRNA lysidine(34) synthetase TilS [Bifidobacterium sp. UTBIF-78]TPF92053.1 tRNA(Ile)-lysidine synthetase [Bifidobacterium sp. UTBIF-78]
MPYTARLRKAVGLLRAALAEAGLERQSPEFARHGEHAAAEDAPLVLVACSGGRDSMALAAVARIVCASLGLRCGAVIVDHGMQDGSDRIAEAAASRCRTLGLAPVLVRPIAVRESGEGPEAAAREARYRELVAVAHESHAAALLLAHTMDDQAETMLIGLLRNRGTDALAGMPASFARGGVAFLRPWLALARVDTTGICADFDLEYWDDPTNGESVVGELPRDYPLRSRVRHDLLPAIARFAGGDVTRHLAESAELARRDKDYLDECADRVMARAVTFAGEPAASPVIDGGMATALDGETVLTIDARMLEAEHPAIRARVIAHALERAGIAAGAAQVDAIGRLVTDWHGQGAVRLPRGYSANRKKHVIRVCQDGAHANR